MKQRTVPKAISAHPAVLEAAPADSDTPDYKWQVYLRDGWQFARGRTAGTRSLFCNTVADFKHAEPIRGSNV